MAVPNIFASATSAIPLSQLDQNFATAITLGNTAVYLGNTTTSLGNVTLTNVTISSGNVTLTGANVSGTANVSTLIVTGNQTSLGNVAITGNISANIATFGAGSNTAPSITTTGDTNTGIFFPAADTIAFTEGGVESMRIDSSGNLGLGVTPSAIFSSYKGIQLVDATSLGLYGSPYGSFLTTNAYPSATGGVFTRGGNSYRPTKYNGFDGAHIWSTAAAAGTTITWTDAMTLDASGNLGIGTTNIQERLTVQNNIQITNSASNLSGIYFGTNANPAQRYSYIESDARSTGYINFNTNALERMRITSSGEFLVGKTSASFGTAGISLRPAADSFFTTDGGNVIAVNRLTNDGNLVEFAQASTIEGAISVSGTTVTYGGGHLARFGQLPDGSENQTLLKGTVLTNLDEMCVWINKETGIPADNEQCNKVKISDVDGDANVAGVFVSWSYDEQHDTNDLFVAMTGDMIIRIAQGTTVQRGDLLMSAGDGTAKPQGDDIVRSKTVAKVTSTHVTCTYADGSYCVPCVLMAC